MIRTLQIHQSILKRSFGAATGSHATSAVCGGVSCEWNSRFRSSRRFSTSAAEDRLLVIGSGVAGSAAALIAAETYRIPVTLLFAGNVPEDCNSSWAQGGIIYRNYDPESGDSAESLAQDIHRAGAGLCEDPAVRKVAEEGPDRVRQLLLNGGPYADVPFDKRADGELSLCLGK
jgi:L-aspartate oxidase